MPDPIANFAYSTVATAPSPATTGTSLVVAAGEGTRFPDPASVGAYNVTVKAQGERATPSNSEIVRVTAKSTDTLTIVREQEGTTARTVIVGDEIFLAPTEHTFGQIHDMLAPAFVPHASGQWHTVLAFGTATSVNSPTAGFLLLTPVLIPARRAYDRIAVIQTGTGATNYRLGVYGPIAADGAWTGLPLVVDGGAAASGGAGTHEVTIATTIDPGWYLLAAILETSREIRSFTAAFAIGQAFSAPGATANVLSGFVAQAYGALPSTIPATVAWTTQYYGLFIRST